jgi:hypothetical protein
VTVLAERPLDAINASRRFPATIPVGREIAGVVEVVAVLVAELATVGKPITDCPP